jgi:hypothetical protein
MTNQRDPDLNDDDILMQLLGETLDEAEPLSDELVDTVANAAFELRRLDAIIADLIFDSTLEAGGTRSDDTSRNLVYAKNGIEVELELDADGETVHGLVQPADTACAIESPSGTQPIDVDEFGRFDVSVSARRFRVILTPPSGALVATPWIFR